MSFFLGHLAPVIVKTVALTGEKNMKRKKEKKMVNIAAKSYDGCLSL